MRAVKSALFVCAALLAGGGAPGATAEERLPPPPAAYFNDYAGLVPPADAARLEAKLRDLQRETSNQVVVAIFPELPSPSLEDFTNRTAESWRAGRKDVDNGVVFFVFVRDRKMRIETGYGLEGALPDALAGRILDEEVVPRFRSGDWTGGIEAGIDAIIAATRGEYQPAPRKAGSVSPLAVVLIVVFLLLFLWLAGQGSRMADGGRTYDRRGWRGGGVFIPGNRSGWGGGGGSWGGGGGSWGGGGGGGFSGGGGSFGGGGASGSW